MLQWYIRAPTDFSINVKTYQTSISGAVAWDELNTAVPSDCAKKCQHHANNTECPKCQTSRYKRGNDGGDEVRRHGAPQKVAWYFPLIPRLRRLFA